MGLVNAKIILRNPRRPELSPLEIEAFADTGAVHLYTFSYTNSAGVRRGWQKI